MQVCTSLQTDNHASTPILSFFTGRMPFLPPNQQRQSTEGIMQRQTLLLEICKSCLHPRVSCLHAQPTPTLFAPISRATVGTELVSPYPPHTTTTCTELLLLLPWVWISIPTAESRAAVGTKSLSPYPHGDPHTHGRPAECRYPHPHPSSYINYGFVLTKCAF